MSIQLKSRPPLSSNVHGFIRHAYSVHLPVKHSFPAESRFTRQEFKDECDINSIMRRYQSTGELPHLNLGTAQFLDVSSSLVFQESMNFIAEAQSMFNDLPSAIRDRFHNDPSQFLEFCSNGDNRKELAQMGLLSPEATLEALSPSPPTTPTASAPPASAAPPEATT